VSYQQRGILGAKMSKQTGEIAKAIGFLSQATLKASLEQLVTSFPALKDKKLESLSKDELLQLYQEAVLDVGLHNFIDKLGSSDLKSSCATLSLEHKDDEACKKLLKEKLEGSKGGIQGLIDKADETLLKNFCTTLGLEPDDKDDMIKQIADEVMLTGMESYLNKLSTPILKSHCNEMKLTTSGNKSQMVERLMVNIFELEPLEGEEKTKSKSKEKSKSNGDVKKTKSSKEKSPKSKEKEKSKSKEKSEKKEKTKEKSGKEEKKEKEKEKVKEKVEKKEKKEKKEKASPKKREKFVAPPLTEIRKGKWDNYHALYDHYNLPDLQAYCRQENIKISGKKPQLIKRVLEYLDKGKVEEKPSKKRKRGASATTKKAPATKKQKKEGKEDDKEEKKEDKKEDKEDKKEDSKKEEKAEHEK